MDSNNMNNQNYQQQNYQQQPYQQQPYQQQPVYNNFYQAPQIPEEYKPISMWGYFGYELLFAIPIIGFILLIVMSFAPANKNVKNFARSYFCLFIIAIILGIILVATGAFAAISMY
ncbi:MAG: hypothetical protein KBG42_07695 [Lachnospiraceae bacterium]|nr:hypothetical protein [Lachnospiraceae bacterium]